MKNLAIIIGLITATAGATTYMHVTFAKIKRVDKIEDGVFNNQKILCEIAIERKYTELVKEICVNNRIAP